MTVQTFSLPVDPDFIKIDEALSAPGDTTAQRFSGGIVIQIAGSATTIDAIALRSPDGAADNYSPAGDPLIGSPLAGMEITLYDEPAVGFWKVRVNSISGTAKIHLSGKVGG